MEDNNLNHVDIMPLYIEYFNIVQVFYGFVNFFEEKSSIGTQTPENTIKDEGVEIDLSDTRATGKIIYLKELGILDILRNKQPFNISTNALATVLSAITGESNTTIQSYISPMLNDKNEQKNDPYNNFKAVNKIKVQLNKIGFQHT